MQLSSGVDIIEIARLEEVIHRHGERFLQRIYTSKELAETNRNPASLAVRFAAKEAVAKALGSGIGPVGWKEIEVLYSPTRKPTLHLHGAASALAAAAGLQTWSLSLSHSQTHAIAFVVAIGD